MSPMKKPPTCDCPRFAKASKFINHTLACLRARRGDVSVDKFYGSSTESGRQS